RQRRPRHRHPAPVAQPDRRGRAGAAHRRRRLVDAGEVRRQAGLDPQEGEAITGINRLGLVIALPQPVANHAAALGSQQWLIDGEAIGDAFVAFDLLESACIDVRSQPYAKRYKALAAILSSCGGDRSSIQLVETATRTAAKR